jgi:hypothetical protein
MIEHNQKTEESGYRDDEDPKSNNQQKDDVLNPESDRLNHKTIRIGLKTYEVKDGDLDEDNPANDRFESVHHHLDLSSIPTKIYVLCFVLDILGFVYMILTFVFLGLEQYSTCMLFGIFTVIIWTPGIYFTVKLIQARRAKTADELDAIINEIPI